MVGILLSAIPFILFSKMTDDELIDKLRELAKRVSPVELDKHIRGILHTQKEMLTAFQREQLAAGQDALGRLLRPTYLGDPFFKTEKRATAYKRYKDNLASKPKIEYGKLISLEPAPSGTPNLYITGDFHRSIQIENIEFAGGKTNITVGSSSGIKDSILSKYGREVLGIQERFMDIIYEYYIKDDLDNYFNL